MRRAYLSILAVVALAAHAKVYGQDGRRQWGPYSLYGFTASSPALSPDGQTIYIGVETYAGGGRILAIPQDGGDAKWAVNRAKEITASPAVSADGSTLYIGCEDGYFYALNAATGAEKWKFNTRTFGESSAAIAEDGTIYFGAGDSKLHALTPQGEERWAFPTNGWIDSSPAIGADGTIYIGSDDQHLYAVTPSGEQKWRFPTSGRLYSSPAIGADGTIYIGSSDQRLYAIDSGGTKRWDFLTNGKIEASPTIGADGTIYFGSFDGYFYALNPAGSDEQRLKWKTPLNAGIKSTATVRADGVIIFGSDGSKLWALDPDNGTPKWVFDATTKDLVDSSPVIAPDGSIYMGVLDGNLYKINGNGSPVSRQSPWPAFRRNAQHAGRAATRASGRLVNLATRARAGGGNDLIAGFVVQNSQGTPYLIRGAGPSLAAQGVSGFMEDPILQLHARNVPRQRNDDWPLRDPSSGLGLADTMVGVGAFPFLPGSRDAAMLPTLESGDYTAHVTTADGSAGVALVEIYDAARNEPGGGRLINLSIRGNAAGGENILIAGFVIDGGPMRLLLRGIGPGLAAFGVSGVLPRPRLEILRGQTSLGTNSDWRGGGVKYDLIGAAVSAGAFTLADDRPDTALLFDAEPGLYTIQISGMAGTTGEAMVEIYVLP